MHKLKSILQMLLAALCLLLVIATAINLGNILLRPESVSVVNALVGQSVLIICFLALARILWRKGWAGLQADNPDKSDSPPQSESTGHK
ncbi:MAG: hypothetical protein RQ757_00160 [Pseudomonadales bacterium]|nr:hypothetical protein [Pseudomonadales bacterium]